MDSGRASRMNEAYVMGDRTSLLLLYFIVYHTTQLRYTPSFWKAEWKRNRFVQGHGCLVTE